MEPYVIRQGDYLLSLAYQFGFDADAVWNDPKNADLRQLRSNPNILYPTDLLYIPDPTPAPMTTLTVGTTNSFVASAPTVTITLTFSDTSLASQAYTVRELEQLTGLTSDATGTVTFTIPVTLATATIVFTASGATYVVKIGNLDPIDTLSGVFQRLQHLGFIDDDAECDSSNLEPVRLALRNFKATQSGGSAAGGDSSPASSPSPTGDGGAFAAPPPAGSAWATAPPSSDNGADPAASSPPSTSASTPPRAPNESSHPPPSGPASAPADSPTTANDNGGLSDDGILDDATSSQLLAAHGS